jgi:hypothetical protein
MNDASRRGFLKRFAGTAAMTVVPGYLVSSAQALAKTRLVVEAEDDLYSFAPANNGATPMWCRGSTCLVRIGDDVFASGLETIAGASPPNNCRWTLYKRGGDGWRLWSSDVVNRTREPCPIAGLPGGPLFLSANPTLGTGPEPKGGPAQPQLLEFDPKREAKDYKILLPEWTEPSRFTQHSYRSFAADAANRELILFQNVGDSHAEWVVRDGRDRWSAQGKLVWPWEARYEEPQRLRVCYPNVALHDRAVHFCGVTDILEPQPVWREYKRKLTNGAADYVFRRLYYTWNPDITSRQFSQWLEVSSREDTAGWISPGDLWLAPDRTVHIVWVERRLDGRLKEAFFPNTSQVHTLNYAILRHGLVVHRKILAEATEEVPSAARLHATPTNRLFLMWYVSGRDSAGHSIAENRIVELRGGGMSALPQRIPLGAPFQAFFTTTPRGGSLPSSALEILGQRRGNESLISYARIRIRD